MKISVITVVKNGMPYLKTAIESVNKQKNINNSEHIVVYSSSEDTTEEFLKAQSNIQVIFDNSSKNKFGSINKGIIQATGDIIGLLHSDDIFYNEYTLSEINNSFQQGYDVVYGNILFCKKNNIREISREWVSSNFDIKKLKYGWMPPHTSIFINSKVLKENLYDEEYPISGDYLFILKLLNLPNLKIKYLNKNITIMRDGGDSTKINNIYKKFKEDINIAKRFFKFPLIVIFLKVILKLKQLKFSKNLISNNYIDNLNN